MSDRDPVFASVTLDDVPLNASYWWRLQQTALGYQPSEMIWGDAWRNQAAAPFFTPPMLEEFIALVEEFGLRGKFSVVPRLAGLGRIDQSVRGMPDGDRLRLLDLLRRHIAPRFDITPEVLTHSMALDIPSGGLLPHSETAWLSHLARTRRIEELAAYLRHAYEVLRSAGFAPRGLSVGGMTDPSGIAQGEMLVHGHHLPALAEALALVEPAFNPGIPDTFMFVGGKPGSQRGQRRGLPEVVYTAPAGLRVFNLFSNGEEALAPLFAGVGDPHNTAEGLVSADLGRGVWIQAAEAGRAVVFNIHGQTLASRGTGLGLKCLGIALTRLRQRYGTRLRWCTAVELCRVE